MHDLIRLLQSLYSTPWAFLDSHLQLMEMQVLQAFRTGNSELLNSLRLPANAERPETMQARTVKPANGGSGVGVLPIQGPIGHRANFYSDYFGWPTTERLGQSFQQMVDDPNVGAIILDINSPGGTAVGNEEFHNLIMKNKGKKPVVGVANGMAASAGYYIISAADEIVVTPSGEVGSIGTVMLHANLSKMYQDAGIDLTVIKSGKYKWEGHPYAPLDEEALAEFQRVADAHYELFTKAVARGRNISVSTVKNDFGQGRMLMAKDAVKAGMADKVGTLDETLRSFGASSQSTKTRMEDETPQPSNQSELERLRLKNKLLEL